MFKCLPTCYINTKYTYPREICGISDRTQCCNVRSCTLKTDSLAEYRATTLFQIQIKFFMFLVLLSFIACAFHQMYAAVSHRLQPQEISQIHAKPTEKWSRNARLVFKVCNDVKAWIKVHFERTWFCWFTIGLKQENRSSRYYRDGLNQCGF